MSKTSWFTAQLLGLGVLVVALLMVPMQVLAAGEKESNAETLARKAALANVRSQILALKITPRVTVENFANTNKDTRQAVAKWLTSIKRGKASTNQDGVITVTVKVSMRAVRMRLSDIYASYYDGTRIKSDDISNIAATNNCKELLAKGTSTSTPATTPVKKPSDEIPTPVPVDVTPVVSPDLPTTAPSDNCWKNDVLPRQERSAKLMAELNAKKDALYRLGQRMRSVEVGAIKDKNVTKKFTVNDFIVNSTNPDVDMSEFLRAAIKKQITLRPDMPVCEIQMQTELKPTIAVFKSWADENYTDDKGHIQLLRDYVENAKPETITEIGTGVVPAKYLKEKYQRKQELLVKFASRPPLWISETITVTGEAPIEAKDKKDDKNAEDEEKTFAAAKAVALEAAKANAERKLQAKLLELELPIYKSVKNLTAKSPELVKQLRGVKTNVEEVNDPQLQRDKIVRVKLSANLKPVWDIMLINCSKNRL